MLQYQKNNPNSLLFYAVILNDTEFYIYDMLNIDYSKVNIADWTIRETEFDPDSKLKTYKIFQLPWNLALKHANIKQITEEKTPPPLF